MVIAGMVQNYFSLLFVNGRDNFLKGFFHTGHRNSLSLKQTG